MKPQATFSSTSGYNFFLIHKQVGANIWKPIYKSENQQATNGSYNWNLVNVLSSDIAGDDVDKEVRLDFF